MWVPARPGKGIWREQHAIYSHHVRKRKGPRDHRRDGAKGAAQLCAGLYRGRAAAVLLRGRRGDGAERGNEIAELTRVAFLARLIAVVERFVKIIKIDAVVLIWQETAIRGMNLFT